MTKIKMSEMPDCIECGSDIFVQRKKDNAQTYKCHACKIEFDADNNRLN